MSNSSRSDFQRMVSGHLYNATAKDVQKKHEEGMSRCDRFNRIPYSHKKRKQRALEKLIPSCKDRELGLFSPFQCEYGINIHVGRGCFVNYNGVFLDIAPITLGDQVWIGANVTLATPLHPLLAEERIVRQYPDGIHDLEYAAPITIEDNVWIASGVIVCGGVHIGKNSVIAAGSVVTHDIPANVLAGGVPAQVIRPLDEKDRLDVYATYEKDERPLSFRKKEASHS